MTTTHHLLYAGSYAAAGQPGIYAFDLDAVTGAFTPHGRLVVVADLGVDILGTYKLDTAAGRLEPQSQVPARPGAGPRHMAWHPTRRRLYVANELENTVALYDYYATRGRLAARQV